LNKNFKTYLKRFADVRKTNEDRQNPFTGAHDNSKEDKSKQQQDEKSEQTRQAATKKEEKAKLQECMDHEFDKRKHTLEAYRQMQDVDGMWKMISTTVEKAWLTYLDDSKTMKQNTGRGELKIIERKPKAEEEERRSKGHRSKWHHKAVEKLRQARRCEQAAYRIGIKDKLESKGKQQEYQNLNDAAFNAITKHIDRHDEEERNFAGESNERFAGRGMDTMQIPMLKRQAEHIHQKHDAMRRKAVAEEEEAKQQVYRAKGGGQWKLNKAMDEKGCQPISSPNKDHERPQRTTQGHDHHITQRDRVHN
jgi:hypothetical protein